MKTHLDQSQSLPKITQTQHDTVESAWDNAVSNSDSKEITWVRVESTPDNIESNQDNTDSPRDNVELS